MQLFQDKIELINQDESVILYKGFFDEIGDILSVLDTVNFSQNKIKMFGNEFDVPRLEAWFGNQAYTYTGVNLRPQNFPKWLMDIQLKITKITGHKFNSVLINKYRCGKDYVSWHQDNEPELGADPVIASLSFGATRRFRLRNLTDKNRLIEANLNHGDLLVMGPGIQHNWQHEAPKSKKVQDVRYNLTFRDLQ